MLNRRSLLSNLFGTAAAATFSPFCTWAASAEAGAISYGLDREFRFPTDAEIYVAETGDDAAEGTLEKPLRTIQAGVDRLAGLPGGSLAIRSGVYRELVSLDKLRGKSDESYRIFRFGTEHVTITASDVITGWRPCGIEDATALGIPDSAAVWTVRLGRESLTHNSIFALNLHEAGEWRSIATDRADFTRLDFPADFRRFHAAEFLLDDENHILAIRDPRLIGARSSWLKQAQVQLYHAPNFVSTSPIADFDPTTGTLLLFDQTKMVQITSKAPQMLYALQNFGPALKAQTWIARDSRDYVDIFFWPSDTANLENNIEISLRPVCIEVGNASHVELGGLDIVRASGEDRLSGIGVCRDDVKSPGERLSLVHCRVGENYNASGRGYGAVYLRGAVGLSIKNCSIGPTRNAVGIFLHDCEEIDLRFLHIAGVSRTPARFFGVKRAVLCFSLFEDSAYDAHSNNFSFYEGCDSALIYGLRCQNMGGYGTFQEASRLHFAFCSLECSPLQQNRALVSQNRGADAGQGGPDGSGDPIASGTFYYWNNSFITVNDDNGKANSLQLGPSDNSQRHAFHNNIIHGGGFSSIYLADADPTKESRSYNLYTGLSYWQNARHGWRMGTGEAILEIGENPSSVGLDMRPIISKQIGPLFPTFTDWDRDVNGELVDWSRPPVGCSVDFH